MDRHDQNILKWAALLHDIVKRGNPLFEGKDHIHPFLSGRATLIIFKKLGKILNKGCPDAYFIPEIWQGHKDSGLGFWTALEKIEGII